MTRCPLELKLRKLKNGPWSGNISYSGHKEHFDDPLKVDNLIREGRYEQKPLQISISGYDFLTNVCVLTQITLKRTITI